MTEQSQPVVKKELAPDVIIQRQVEGMSNRRMSNRLKRITQVRGLKLKKSPPSNIDATWAIVLSAVFDNTKPLGRMEPYLR